MGCSRPEKRGACRVPWYSAALMQWPSLASAGQECGLIELDGYSSGCDVVWNPNGNAIPANAYELRVYAVGENFTCLAAKATLGSATLALAARQPASSWEIRVGLLQAIALPRFSPPPSVSAIAHGRESGRLA